MLEQIAYGINTQLSDKWNLTAEAVTNRASGLPDGAQKNGWWTRLTYGNLKWDTKDTWKVYADYMSLGNYSVDSTGWAHILNTPGGDGLGGNSVNYGFAAATDEEYLSAVVPRMKNAKVTALLLPGIGTVDHLKMAHEIGVSTIRVATHSTEADVSEQHITAARKLGMDTVGFLMMAHMATPEKLLEEAKMLRVIHNKAKEKTISFTSKLFINNYLCNYLCNLVFLNVKNVKELA